MKIHPTNFYSWKFLLLLLPSLFLILLAISSLQTAGHESGIRRICVDHLHCPREEARPYKFVFNSGQGIKLILNDFADIVSPTDYESSTKRYFKVYLR